jgi:predicted Zn-dependent protease
MVAIALGLAWACATSPTGRRQLMLVSDSQMNQMGVQAFQQMKATTRIDRNGSDNAYVQCVARAITSVAGGDTKNWEVVVFQDPAVNAFALPGGKIGVYTGLLTVAKNDAQLATVVGHEVGHVLARHGAERVSQQVGTQAALTGAGAIAGGGAQGQAIMGALGVGAQVGVLLPFSRAQESEADAIGLDLMAKAGFDPQQSVELWKNMKQASGGNAPAEFLSTHPSDVSRIQDLQARMPEALKEYQAAEKAGLRPHCEPPRTLLGAATR